MTNSLEIQKTQNAFFDTQEYTEMFFKILAELKKIKPVDFKYTIEQSSTSYNILLSKNSDDYFLLDSTYKTYDHLLSNKNIAVFVKPSLLGNSPYHNCYVKIFQSIPNFINDKYITPTEKDNITKEIFNHIFENFITQ